MHRVVSNLIRGNRVVRDGLGYNFTERHGLILKFLRVHRSFIRILNTLGPHGLTDRADGGILARDVGVAPCATMT